MKKVLTITLVVFALFTLKSNAFAAAANVPSWEETAAKRSGQYYTLTAPIDYSNIQANPQSDIALLPWEETTAKKAGYYHKVATLIDYSRVQAKGYGRPLQPWEETTAKRYGDYYKIAAPKD